MIGTFRMILALCVVVAHLLVGIYPIGSNAVFGFYVLSGYLIAGILDNVYRQRLGAYLANRALRIFPVYWVVALIGIAAATWGTPLNPVLLVPETLDDAWRQVTIFGLLRLDGQGGHLVRLVPPAWSLNVELVYYLLLIPMVRFPLASLALFAAVAAWTIVTADYMTAYWSFLGPGFCFALGVALRKSKLRLARIHFLAALALIAALHGLALLYPQEPAVLYAAALAAAYAIAAADFRLPRLERADWWMGRMSYPVFLAHWAVASLLMLPRGPALLALALPATLAVSYLLVRFVEMPVERLRRRIRAAPAPLDAPGLATG